MTVIHALCEHLRQELKDIKSIIRLDHGPDNIIIANVKMSYDVEGAFYTQTSRDHKFDISAIIRFRDNTTIVLETTGENRSLRNLILDLNEESTIELLTTRIRRHFLKYTYKDTHG